jgi:hypothetical protein
MDVSDNSFGYSTESMVGLGSVQGCPKTRNIFD